MKLKSCIFLMAGLMLFISQNQFSQNLPKFEGFATKIVDTIRTNKLESNFPQEYIPESYKDTSRITPDDLKMMTNDTIIRTEKEPIVDLSALAKNVEYPKEAWKAGIQGQVVVRVLIDKNGKAITAKIEKSDNIIFNQSALNAVYKTAYTPGYQNGVPVACWVSIPINYKLKDPVKK